MITNKPVVYLRSTEAINSFLKSLDAYETILRIFNVRKTITEESEEKQFASLLGQGLPVISLAKHLSGDYNFSYSRCYDLDTLQYVEHIRSPETTSDLLSNFKLRNQTVILFDEDIGGGYLIEKLKNSLRTTNGITVDVQTFVKFDPKFEEVLDLKDFIYKYSDSSGLVIKDNEQIFRVPYMLNTNILEKFASIRPTYLDNFGAFCWVLSYLYHINVTHNQTYQYDCYRQLIKVYQWNLPINTESMKEFCLEYLKLYF